MGLLVKAASGVEKTVKGVGKGTHAAVTKFPKSSALGVGYIGGVAHSGWVHSHPEFYDGTPNKGRSEDKHPQGEPIG